VSAETPRCVAVSLIDKSMCSTVGHLLMQSAHVAYADYGQFGGGSTASVDALRRSSGLPAARLITVQSLLSLKGNKSW
jgi:hypothetical protein